MLDWLIVDFTRRAVEGTDRFVAVHAAVAAHEGRAALLVAPPDSGKTTLVAGLTRSGFGFLSDEVALLEPSTARVHPFLRPLMVEPSSMEVLDGLAAQLPAAYSRFRGSRFHVAPDDLRQGAVGRASRVAFVILPAYRDGAETTLRRVSRAETLIRTIGQTFNLSTLGPTAVRTLAEVISGAECFELPIGDLEDAIEQVDGLFQRNRPVGRPG